jgi:predicted restriction endonuclease
VHSPIRPNGIGNQAVYLAEISEELAAELSELLSGQGIVRGEQSLVVDAVRERAEQAVAARIQNDPELTTTAKKRLTDARLGQGAFRKRVEAIEVCCRVTGISDRRFLRASHIWPWSKADNRQRLDGSNGLLLAPHIDHLFDKGFITFADDGELLVSKSCAMQILAAFGMQLPLNVGPFSAEQCVYLRYHRKYVFQER